MLDQGAEEILDHPPPAGLDFHGHGHAGRQVDGFGFDLHGGARQFDFGRVDQAALFVVDGVGGNLSRFAVQRTIKERFRAS